MKLPERSEKLNDGIYSTSESIIVYKEGDCWIEKSAENNEFTGFRIPGSIVYTVYQDENACGVVDASKKLTEAKKILKQQLKN